MGEDALELLSVWTQALLKERDHERAHIQAAVAESSLKVRRAEGLSWSPVEVIEASYAFGGAKWSLACQEGGGLAGIFRVGAAVLLTPIGERDEVEQWGTWPARVLKSSALTLDVVLDGEGPEGIAVQHIHWTVDLRSDERSFNAMAHALSHWINVESPEEKKRRDLALGFEGMPEQIHDHSKAVPVEQALNHQQKLAVQKMVTGGNVVLLHGPPGTGKTKTLVAGIQALAKQHQKVLATAPSNMAVDVLVERLAKAGLRVVRIGHPMKVSPDVLETTLDHQTEREPAYKRVVQTRREAEQKQREADRFVRNFGAEQRENRRRLRSEARSLRKEANELEAYISEKILREADVICATLVGADDRRLWPLGFDVAVVDEAAQALPPATLIAMRRAPRLVLCGDPHQLPPTIKCKDAQPLASTMLERLIARHPEQTIMLEVQHRMHEAIMSAGNAKFYNGRLQAHPTVAQVMQGDLRPWLWIDTAGCGFDERRSQEGASVSNLEEGQFVLNRAADLMSKHPEMSLGIIAPYAAQVDMLQGLWKEKVAEDEVPGGLNVVIHTVDGFQGQERDAILVSCTRSNDRGEVGFLSESRRIHVAQTRARRICWIVGDSATLGQDAYLGWLIEHAQSLDAYDSAWTWMG